MLRQLTLGLALCATLSACGGGSTSSSLPQAPSSSSPSGVQSVTLSVKIPPPPSGVASLTRRPLYVSSNTQSARITVSSGATTGTPVVANLAAGAPGCIAAVGGGRTCSISVTAPVGTDTFAEILYASTDGTGPALSQSTTSATIAAGKANIVNIALGGVVASISMTLSNATPPVGTPGQSIGLTVNFNDASGAAIVGSDPFANPISLTDSDQSKTTQLSKQTLNSPADAVGLTISYGGQPLSSAVFSASATGVVTATVTLTPHGQFNDYTTFGYDNQRDVYNPYTTAITPASVASVPNGQLGLHLAWQTIIGGGNGDFNVQSQPVLATEIPNHAGVLFVGGGSGYESAHDALTGNVVWKNSVYTGLEKYQCDPTNLASPPAYFGVGGTVAYDPATASLYVVGNNNTTANAFAQNVLLHLDGATGATLGTVNFGADQAGPGELNFSHTSVTLASNGLAYVGTGATCDVPSWRGRVAAIDTRSMTLAHTFFTVWDPQNVRGNGAQSWGGGGVWGWGGVSLDFNGNVLTGIGNTDNGTSLNGTIQSPFVAATNEYDGYGESLIQLTGDLSTVLADNHPIPHSVYSNNASDLDVNGTPVIFKPLGAGCGTMAALQAKSGALILYNTSTISSGPSARFQLAPSVYADGFLGSPAFSPATNLLYAPVASSQPPDLYAPGMIAINPCGGASVTWRQQFGPDSSGSGVPRSVPAVSAGGVVFVATTCNAPSGPCGADGGYGALWELDASNGTILNGGMPVLYTNATIRAPATIDGNWVFVIDQLGEFYGLTIDPNYKKIAATRRSVNTHLLFNRTTTQANHRR